MLSEESQNPHVNPLPVWLFVTIVLPLLFITHLLFNKRSIQNDLFDSILFRIFTNFPNIFAIYNIK